MLRLVPAPGQLENDTDASCTTDPLAAVAMAAARGDDPATETLIASVGPAMLRAARGVLGSNHRDIEDVLQESILGLLDALPSFGGRCTVIHFASRITVLKSIDARRRCVRSDKRSEELHPTLSADESSPADYAGAAERRDLLRQLCDELPASQSEALILHCALGFTVEEVAAVARVPHNTVRSRLRLAKEALRSKISANPHLQQALETIS